MGANVSLSPLYAWAQGRACSVQSAAQSGKNVTPLASMTSEGMGPCIAVVGSTTRAAFEAYVERMLAPKLSSERVAVMDNLSAHKGGRLRELIEGAGCEVRCTCRPTRLISTPPSRPLPRSRGCSGKRGPAPARRSSRRWERRFRRSVTGTPRASWGTAATAPRPNRYDRRSNMR